MDRSGRYQIHHNTRHPIGVLPGRTKVLFLGCALGRLPPAIVEGIPAAARRKGGFVDAGVAPIDGDRRDSEAVLHGAGIAGGRVFLQLGDADEDIALGVGVVQVEARIDIPAGGNHQARVLLPFAEIIGVFELDVGGGAQNIVRLQIRLEQEFLYGLRGGPETLHQADARRPGLGYEVHRGADHRRVGEMRIGGRKVSQALLRGAGQVELDGHGLPFDQFADAAELVEHPGHHGQQFLGVVGLALGNRYRGRRRKRGTRRSECRSSQIRAAPHRSGFQPISAGTIRRHALLNL